MHTLSILIEYSEHIAYSILYQDSSFVLTIDLIK